MRKCFIKRKEKLKEINFKHKILTFSSFLSRLN